MEILKSATSSLCCNAYSYPGTIFALDMYLKLVKRYFNGSVVNLLCTTTFEGANVDYLTSIYVSQLGILAFETVNACRYCIGRNRVISTMCTPGLIVDQVSASASSHW